MNSKLQILIEEYNTNSKTPSNHGEEWKLIDTKEYVLGKFNKQEQEIIDNSNNIVFFGGAGVSTASGIKDFRSTNGLYHEKYKW